MWYVYVLTSDIRYSWHYYGYSADLKKRMTQHSRGEVKATKPYLPLKLIYYEAYYREDLARKRESTLKSSRSATSALHKRLNIGA